MPPVITSNVGMLMWRGGMAVSARVPHGWSGGRDSRAVDVQECPVA